jgi:hypothetical protein
MGLNRSLFFCFLSCLALAGCASESAGSGADGMGPSGYAPDGGMSSADSGYAPSGGTGGSSASGQAGYGGYAGGYGGYGGESGGAGGYPAAGSGGAGGAAGTGGTGWDAGAEADALIQYSTYPDYQAQVDPQGFQDYLNALDQCLPAYGDSIEFCAAQSCGEVNTCCVGQGDCCDATAPGLLPGDAVDFSVCAGQQPATCLSGEGWPAEAFGPRQSQIHGDAFYPGGDDSGDSGLRFEPLFDLKSLRVKVSGVFHQGSAQCGAGCLEGVGIGFASQQDLPADATGDISLLYSRSLGQVRLVRGGTVTAQAAMSEAEQKWTLELQPSGRVLAYADDNADNPDLDSVLEPVSGARLLLFGRSQDPSSSDGVHLSALAVESALCDIPGEWSERGALVLEEADGTAWEPDAASAPSAAQDQDSGATLLAFESGGDIYLAVRDGADPYTFVLYGDGVSPIVSKADVSGAVTLGQPSLVRDGENWAVYFSVNSGGGTQRIASARTPYGGAFQLDEPLDMTGYSGSLDAPSVARREDGKWFMVASPGAQVQDSVLFFASPDGLFWTQVVGSGSPGETLDRACEAAPGSFFCDGVDAPDLSIHHGSWQLHFAGKQGTRWAIGLLVSDVLSGWGWKLMSDGRPVLKASGTGFDRLSVQDPCALGGADSVELFYTGSNGSRTALGRAYRAAASQGSF